MVMIRRDLTPAQLAAFAPPFFPVMLVEIDWPSGWVRAHSGRGTIVWGGRSWTGVGRFGEVRLPEEGAGMAAVTASLTLYGLPEDLLAEIEAPAQGRAAWIGLGALTGRDTNVLVADPAEAFSGYCDASRVSVQPNDSLGAEWAANLTLGSGPSQRSGASIYHSNEDQRSRVPSDTAGRHCPRARSRMALTRWPE